MYINGKWITTEKTLKETSPATHEIVSEIALIDVYHVQQAIDASHKSSGMVPENSARTLGCFI